MEAKTLDKKTSKLDRKVRELEYKQLKWNFAKQRELTNLEEIIIAQEANLDLAEKREDLSFKRATGFILIVLAVLVTVGYGFTLFKEIEKY